MDLPVNGFELLEQLKEKETNPKHQFRRLKNYLELKAREKGIPVFGDFELTPLCNLNCKMCYVHLDADQLKGRSILSVNKWKDLMYQAWKAGMMFANLTGGECLTYPGFEELFLYLHSLGCEVGVLTNGVLLDEKRIQFFKKHAPSVIQVTLYGWNEDVYERVTGKRAFSIVAKNIQHAVDVNLPVCISITPNCYLGEDIFDTIRVAKDLCKSVMINSLYTTPRIETGRADQQGDADISLYVRTYKYLNQLEGRETIEMHSESLPPCGSSCHEVSDCGLLCGGGRSGFSIDWKGTLKPCIDLEAIHAYPLTEGFSAAWTKINREANLWPRVPECTECAYNGVCNNCAAGMLRYASPGKQPCGLCEQTMELVRNGVFHLPECN